MADTKPTPPSTQDTISLSVSGPALFYVSSPGQNGTQSVQRVDWSSLEGSDPRERAICRALLRHALALLDATEPTRPHAVEAGRS